MGSDRAAVRQREQLGDDQPPVRQFVDKALRLSGLLDEFLEADGDLSAFPPQFDQIPPGHVLGDFGPGQPVDLEKAIVEKHHASLRVGHHHALAEVVQGGTDERVPAQFRTPDLAQRRMNPQRERGDKRADDDAADQRLPEHLGVGGADIARRSEGVGHAPGGLQRRSGGDQAHDGPRRNRILAACLPILASHQSPAHFWAGVSDFPGLDRVNAYPHKRKL